MSLDVLRGRTCLSLHILGRGAALGEREQRAPQLEWTQTAVTGSH